MLETTDLSAREIAERALTIAGDICIYTNHNLNFEELPSKHRIDVMSEMTPREIVSELDNHIIGRDKSQTCCCHRAA